MLFLRFPYYDHALKYSETLVYLFKALYVNLYLPQPLLVKLLDHRPKPFQCYKPRTPNSGFLLSDLI